MNTVNSPPKAKKMSPATEESAPLMDTSKMSAGQRAALELTEAARDVAGERGSFAQGLFMGRFDSDEIGRS